MQRKMRKDETTAGSNRLSENQELDDCKGSITSLTKGHGAPMVSVGSALRLRWSRRGRSSNARGQRKIEETDLYGADKSQMRNCKVDGRSGFTERNPGSSIRRDEGESPLFESNLVWELSGSLIRSATSLLSQLAMRSSKVLELAWAGCRSYYYGQATCLPLACS